MKKRFDIKRFTFYLWVGLAFLLLGLFSDAAEYPETFFKRALNNIWGAAYVTVINYFLFEYTLPRLSRKKILISLLRVLGYIFLYSCGAYLWRSMGIGLNIYTSFVTDSSESHAISDRMAYSM